MQLPLVSVVILSFNRRDDLQVTLQKVYEMDYQNFEVIVVDNNSTDGSAEIVKNNFSSVCLISLQKNIGIAGWNEGFKIAKGEFVLVLDDDSYPEKDAVKKGVDVMLKNELCGVAAFSVWNENRKFFETKDYHETKILTTFIGCGALIRTVIFSLAGMFSEILFLYEHEVEFSMRVIDKGYSIFFCQEAQIIHIASPKNRILVKNIIDKRRQFYICRNILLILFMHFLLRNIWWRVIRIIIGRLYFGLKYHCFISSVKGITEALILLITKKIEKKILSPLAQVIYNYGHYYNAFFFEESGYSNKKPRWIKRFI